MTDDLPYFPGTGNSTCELLLTLKNTAKFGLNLDFNFYSSYFTSYHFASMNLPPITPTSQILPLAESSLPLEVCSSSSTSSALLLMTSE